MAGEITANALVLLWARRQVAYDKLGAAITALSVGVWVIAATIGIVAPVVMPVALLLMVMVMSVMLALPYVGGRTLMRLIVGAVIVSGLVAPFHLGEGLLGVDLIPRWIVAAVLAVFVPVVSAQIFLLVWHYSRRLNETLDDMKAAVLALQESERHLEGRVEERTEELDRL